jgi:hypothetical protein
LLEFWNTLQISSPVEAWHDFPPLLRAIMTLAVALLLTHFFVRDYNRSGKRFIVYGPVALLLFVYAIFLFGFF